MNEQAFAPGEENTPTPNLGASRQIAVTEQEDREMEAIARREPTYGDDSQVEDPEYRLTIREAVNNLAAQIREAREDYEGTDREAREDYEGTDLAYCEIAKPIIEARNEAIRKLGDLVGLDHHWQDEEGIVYQVAEMTGKFVYFVPYEIKRTRRDGEAKGSLSIKAAKELRADCQRLRFTSKPPHGNVTSQPSGGGRLSYHHTPKSTEGDLGFNC
jgi:hypothetical protein